MKKLLKKLSVMRLEERVLFDAAAAAAAVEADNQAQQNEDLQQQQQQLQEQLAAEEAAQQAQAQAEAAAESTEQAEAAAQESENAEADAAGAAENNGQENVNAGSEVSAAVEAIAADEGVEVEADGEESEKPAEDVVGEALEGLNGVEVEANAETEEVEIPVAENTETEETEVLALTPEEVAASIANGTRHELVIVSDSVKDAKVIIDNLAEGTEVLVLDRESDVLDQINEYLDNSTVKYDAIHVVSHGGDGYLLLNNSLIDMKSLEADPASWAAIGEHVAEDGDILLYGCNVAQSENGKAFANQLASLTGADIAASVDSVGGEYGWELDYIHGAVDSGIITVDADIAKLGSYTLVEYGSAGSGAASRVWQNNAGQYNAAGIYWGFATTTTLGGGTSAVKAEIGQLYSETVTVGENGQITRAYAVVANTGNLNYVMTQAQADGLGLEASSIAIISSNVTNDNIDLGNILNTINSGGLTITVDSDVDVDFIVNGYINHNFTFSGGADVVHSGWMAVGQMAAVSFENTENLTLVDVDIAGGGNSLTISGSVGNIVIEDDSGDGRAVYVGDMGSRFEIVAQSSGFDKGVSNVIVNGDVDVQGGTLTVDLMGNSSSFAESKFIVHGDFYVHSSGMSSAEVSISVTDVSNPNLSLDGAVVNLHYGIDGGGWVNFDSTQDDTPYRDTAVIFDGGVYVNAEGFRGGDLHDASLNIDGGENGVVNFIFVKDSFIVGGDKTEGSFSASDFYSFYFDAGAGKVFSIGNGDSASFTAEDRAGFRNGGEAWFFGSRNRVTVDRSVTIAEGATLTINNLMMDIKDTLTGNNVDFSHLGVINGENSELVFRDGVVISGTDYAGGTVDLASVRYENGVDAAVQRDGGTGMLDTKFNFYHGEYGSLGIWLDGRTDYRIDMDLFQEITIHNVTFINQNNDEGLDVTLNEGGPGVLTGSSGSVTMEGEFAFTEAELPNTTFDFEMGSTVNVIYNRAFEQYILAGDYYELTISNTADKILAGDIVVGVSSDKISELSRYDSNREHYSGKDNQIAARKLTHAYRGGISLGAGLRTMGYDVDFYGYTYASTEKAKIYSENASGNVAGRVSYHVAQTLVNMDRDIELTVENPFGGGQITVTQNPWDNAMGLDLSGITHTDHGVGPGVTGHVRDNEAFRAFFGGTYNNLTIDTMATLPPTAGAQFIPSEEITFTMDDSATIYGDMAVTALWNGATSTQHHYFSVDVTSDVTFVGDDNNIVLDDANLHFSGSVTGNFESITAVRDEYYSANGVNEQTSLGAHERQLSLTFDQKMGNIGLLHTDGVSITFESDVASIRNVTVGTPGLHTGKVNTRDEVLTFNGAVELVESVVTTRQFDDVKPVFNFNGETTGNAVFSSFRSVVNFNHRGDLTIFQGAYDELNIAGEGDQFIDGVKTIIGNTTVGGTFNANLANITIQNGTLSLQTFYEDYANDPHRPNFTVNAGAALEFRAANTEGIRFYGTIESAGTITILGRGNFYGDITLTGEGNMVIDGSAEGSQFERVINRGSGFDIVRDININELHNYGEITIHNNNVGIDVYNHAGGNLVFDLNAGVVGANGYEFNFTHGEGQSGDNTIEWNRSEEGYVVGDEVRHGNMFVANGDVPAGVEPGVEYWREIDEFDNSIGKTYKIGDVVYNTVGGVTRVYRAIDTYVPGGSSVTDTDYWQFIGEANTHNTGNTYGEGELVSNGGRVYVAMTAVAAGTVPGTTYWTPIAQGNGTNRLINGGTITVNNGTVNLNNFTQGDKNAETGKWTFGGEGFVVNPNGTLVFGATVNQINTGNSPTAEMGTDYYLGNIQNSGTVKVDAAAGNVKFDGSVENAAQSKFILANALTTFNGDFTHDGSLTSEGDDKAIIFGTDSVVSGSGTIGGTAGYDGTVTYNGSNQQILTGIYNRTVTLSEGDKSVAGDIVFNGEVRNAAVITGSGNNITFNAVTSGVIIEGTEIFGEFAGSLNVTYAVAAETVYAGAYGDLNINSANVEADGRTVDTDITAVNLTLNGYTTFNGTADDKAEIVVSNLITLGDASHTTLAEFSSLNANSDTAAVIKGGNNDGSITFTTREIGSNVTVYAEGLLADVTYNYTGAGVQNILSGVYRGDVVLTGAAVKRVSTSVSIQDTTLTSDASQLHIADGGTLEVIGTINVDALKVDVGGTLTLVLTGDSALGTIDDTVTTDPEKGKVTGASDTGVIFGGMMNIRSNTGASLTIYGWQDMGTTGEIHLASGTLVFAGTPDVYGYVRATVAAAPDAIVTDDNDRLHSTLWITISEDSRTSELLDYVATSRFRVINGATLTVDHFALWNDTDSDGVKDPDEEYRITATVDAFSLEGNSTLIIELGGGYFNGNGIPATITVNDLYIENGSQVIFSENDLYTLNIAQTAEINGTVSGIGNVNVNVTDSADVTGSGTFDMAGGKVTYAAGIRAFGGTYNDLELNGNVLLGSAVIVNGTATFAGNITGNSKITFNGKTEGDATFGDASATPVKAYNGLVTYSETSGAIYGGRYTALNIIGNHNVNANLTIDLIEGGVFKLNSTLNLASGVTLTILGETDAAEEGNTGMINGAKSSTVVYGYNADIYSGTYGNLTAVGAENFINGELTVRGEANLTGIFLGEHNVTFKGSTVGDATFGVFGDDTKVFGGRVTYESKAETVYGGHYYDLTIDGDRTLGTSLQVKNSVTFIGDEVQMDASSPVNFAFGANATLNGTDITFNPQIELRLAGALNIADGAKVNINGTTDAGAGNFGYIVAADNSTVAYAETAGVYNGTYGNLNIVGNHVLLGQGTHPDTAAGVPQGIVVNGNANLTGGVISGKSKVTFNGSTSGDATFGEIGVVSYNGTVTYGEAADTIFGGQYTSIDIAGDSSVTHTVVDDLKITVPGGGLFRLASKLVLGENVVLTLDGLTDANDGATGIIEGADSSHVIYSGDAAIYGGTYGRLTLNGAAYELLNDFTVNSEAFINGSTFSGDAEIVFKGAVSGNAVFGNLDTESVYAGSVTYDNTKGDAQTVFGGYYNTLNIIGDHSLDYQLRINAAARIDGVITESSSALDVTFDENAVLTGSGQFGQDAANRYQGTVTYNGVTGDTGVFSGFYSTLKLSGSNATTDANINVDNMELQGVLAVKGNASVELAGTTSGNGTFSATAADADTLVTYADTAKLYGGSYGGLTFGSNRVLDLDMTVYGTATLNGTMTGSADMTFNGGVAGSAAFGTAEDAPYTGKVTYAGAGSDIFGGYYNDLVITGEHTLTQAFVVVATGQAVVNDAVLSGTAAVTLNGTTSGNGRFGVSADDGKRYEGTVTYNRENAHILGGFYGGTKDNPGLVINNSGTIDAGIEVVSFSTALTGTLTVGGSILFSDWTDAIAKGDTAKVEGSGTFAYGTTADIYGGAYANLVIHGDHHFSNSITVNGTTTVYANDHGTESATAARLTGAGGIDLVFKGIVTDEGAKIGLNAYFDLLDDAAPASVTYESAGDVLGGYYNLLNVNGTGKNTVQGDLTVVGKLALANDVALSGTGNWVIGKNNAGSSTAVVNKDGGTVTYNGLADGETGAIYKGTYSGLKVEGGEYSVGDVTINGELSGDTTGKIIFNGSVAGSGSAVGVNAVYNSENTILGGLYNDLGINKESVFAAPVTVNGALTALSDEARITGNGAANTLTLAGSLVGFENRNGIDYAGEIILSGNGNSFVISAEADNRNHIGTLTVGTGVSLELSYANIDTVLQTENESSSTLTDVTVPAITGAGDVLLNANVAVDGFNMTGGTVTYGAEAQTTLVQGNYFNLKLDQLAADGSAAAVSVADVVTVNGTLDVNSHNINNSGDLTIYQFANTLGTVLNNSGKLTFGSNDDSVVSPTARQIWEGAILNTNEVVINRSNYSIAGIIHDDQESSNWGTVTITESAQSKADFSDVVVVGIYSVDGKEASDAGTVINLNANAYLFDVDNSEQFTNRGTLNIGGSAGLNAAPMHIVNVHQGEITVNDVEYTFGKDSVQLTNGGSVTVKGENGVVIFNEVNENISGNPVYTTRGGGTFVFDFAPESINVKNGLLGELKNYEGEMYFLTDGMKYLGSVTNGSGTVTQGNLYIWANSTFRESVSSTYGIIEIADGLGTGEVVEANFLKRVTTGSYFQILDKGRAVFESTLSVTHDFIMESGSEAIVKGDTVIISTSSNTADTVFHIKSGATATFYGNVTNQNGYYHGDEYGWFGRADGSLNGKSLSAVSTPPTYIPEYYSASNWVSELRIDGKITINGVLTNLGHGLEYRAFSEKNQARVVVESDGNVFGAIRNIGMAARFDMNGSHNQFNGSLTNSGELLLNGTNDYNDIINTSWSTSFTVDFGSNDKWSASSSQYGYIWINDGAAGSSFRNVTNNSSTTFTVSSYGDAGIELHFNGDVTNSGTFNINAAGYEFNGEVTNSGTFNVFAGGAFDATVANRGTFNVLVPQGTSTVPVDFNLVNNSGHFTVKTKDVNFDGRFTNSGIFDINVGGITFDTMTNNGTVNLHGALQTIINDLTVGDGSVVDIDKASSLHLHVVTENGVGSFIVRGDTRNGDFAAHVTPDVTDTEHGLFFENTGDIQQIESEVVYDTDFIESAVWFDIEKTIIISEEAKWIIIGDVEWADHKELTLDSVGETAKYKVYAGGTLTVIDAASRTSIRVAGGNVVFDNDKADLTLKGSFDVQSGTVTFDNEKVITFEKAVSSSGDITFNAGTQTVFNNGFSNAGTVAAYTDIKGFITNTGIYTVKSDGIVLNASNFNNTNGTLGVGAKFDLTWDAAGTINVLENGVLSVAVTSLSSNLANAGVVEINNPSNYLFISGNILNNNEARTNGKFTAASAASLVIGGNVETGASATFENIANATYEGYAAEGQNIILGTYNNLTLTAGSAVKIVDDGTVTVNGTFNNGSGVQVTDDGKLILNEDVAGSGSYTNAGTLTFGENASGSAAKVDNSGTVNVDADGFTVAAGNNDGDININGDNASLTVTNQPEGDITVNGSDAVLAGQNNGSVTVNGSAATTMTDQAGATYEIAEKGSLSLGDNGGTYNAAITNNGTLSVDAKVTSFAGGVTNKNVINVNEGEDLDLNALLKGNEKGTLNLNDETNLQNQDINGNVQVNYSLSGDALEGVTVTENSTLGINKTSDPLTSGIADNKGTVQIGKDAALNFDAEKIEFSGNYDVDGTLSTNGDAEFSGTLDNSGTVSVVGDAAFDGPVANSGSVTVDGNAEFAGAVDNDKTLSVGGDAAFDDTVANSGSVTVGGDAEFAGAVDNDNALSVVGDAAFDGPVSNSGSVTVDGNADFNGSVGNTGSISVAGDSTFDGAVNNEGSGTLAVKDAQFNDSVLNDGKTVISGDAQFNDKVNNSGEISTQGAGTATFSGATSGNGTVDGNATYQDEATGVYGGDYSSLTVNNDATLKGDAVAEDITLNDSLAAGKDTTLTINGATEGKGTVDSQGEVVYNGSGDEQSIYAGNYNDLTFGKDASGKIDANGDITISGDAVNKSRNGAELAITDGRVTYNGTGSQHVMAGSYDELVMAGSGSKLMEADMFNVNSFTSNGGNHSNMLFLVSADAPSMWTLNADYSSIHYSYIDNADSTGMYFLDGTNMTGSGNSGNWAVFNGVGGVGEMFPSLANPNFQAIAPYVSSLALEWSGTGRFDIFRRMPVSMAAIAAGDMSDLVTLNTFENYDMIDFDREFFGNAHSIGLLDEESREVLDDAASAGNSDLKALLED